MAVILERNGQLTDDEAKPTGDTLNEYRSQADALKEALAKVKGVQEQIAAVTQQRETLLQQRQTLLDSFENEDAVEALSKLAPRVEMCEAKLVNLAGQLASAERFKSSAIAANCSRAASSSSAISSASASGSGRLSSSDSFLNQETFSLNLSRLTSSLYWKHLNRSLVAHSWRFSGWKY